MSTTTSTTTNKITTNTANNAVNNNTVNITIEQTVAIKSSNKAHTNDYIRVLSNDEPLIFNIYNIPEESHINIRLFYYYYYYYICYYYINNMYIYMYKRIFLVKLRKCQTKLAHIRLDSVARLDNII